MINKSSLSVQAIIDQYKSTCLILRETTLNGDYKTGNKEGGKVVKIFKALERNKELAVLALPKLFKDENVVTRAKAAAHCLSLSITIDKALSVLEEIANDESLGIFSFNAKMTLQVFKKNGYLKVYQSQKLGEDIKKTK